MLVFFSDCPQIGGIQAFVTSQTPDTNDRNWPLTAQLTACSITPGYDSASPCLMPQNSVCPPGALGNWVVLYKADRLPVCSETPPPDPCDPEPDTKKNHIGDARVTVFVYPTL